MKRLRDMKIGYRMGLTFGLVLLLLIGTVAFSLSALFEMSALVDGFYFTSFRVVELAKTIDGSIQGAGRSMMQAIVLADDNETPIQLAETRALVQQVTASIEELETLYAEDDDLIGELDHWFHAYAGYRNQIINLLEAGDYEQARIVYTDSYLEPSTQARHIAVEIGEKAEDAGYWYMVKSNEDALHKAVVISLITLGVIGLSVAMSLWLVRSITQPVSELRQVAEDVAQGKLDVRATYQSANELGELAGSINCSVVALSSYIKEIEQSLTALGHGDLAYQARDIFAGDFVAIKRAIDEIAILLMEQRNQEVQQQQQLRRAYDAANYANRSKSDFLSRMSHDIRTPMNAIIGMTAIAVTNIDDKDKVMECLKKISLSSRHLLGLINDVLDMSKIESGKMTLHNDSMSLPEVMENIVNITQPQIKAKRQRFNIRLHNIKHEWLYCDSLRLNQVFINILSNAVKFTPVGGEISIDVTELPSERGAGYGHYTFVFADSGKGMTPLFVREIFNAFSREADTSPEIDRTEGTGLGMAITKRIVDLMDGTITVQSEVGVGSRFTVDLHLALPDTLPEAMLLPDVRVLLVDDDPLICQTATDALADIGMRADWAESGQDAVARVDVEQRGPDPYHAIILDWQMPDMNGVETARAIRRAVGPNVPILIISAYDWAEVADEAREAGVDGFIAKPLFKSTLYYGLRRFVVESAEDEPSNLPQDEYDLRGKRILLVEDNEINREIAEELLAAAGPEITTAQNGAEAVTLFEQSAVGHFDLVLMDVQMPVMDGYEATRLIRRMHRPDAQTVPILAMTANAFAEDVEEAQRAGMDDHLAKPLDPARLIRDVAKHLESGQPE